MHKIVDMDSIPHARRDSIWRDAVCDAFVRLECRRDSAAVLHGRIESGQLGDLHVARVTSSPQFVERTREQAAQADRAFIGMSIQLRGRTLIRQAGSEALLTPGCVAFYETSRPYSLTLQTEFEEVVLQMPIDLLARKMPGVLDCTAQCISALDPFARALVALAHQLVSFSALPESRGADGAKTAAVELMTLAASTIQENRGMKPDISSTVPSAMVWRARDLISRHACDRTFGPDQLAVRAGVSLRRLQTVFHEQGSSIAETIWEMRLEHARSMLCEDRRNVRTISEIALEAGFADSAHFSRRFKKRFGLSPRDFRSASL